MSGIALFGGSFNPIHYGHLLVAEEARTRRRLDKVVFIPAAEPPHKDPKDLASPLDRLVMTVLATVGNPCFEVSAVEIERGGRSYAIDTVRHFRKTLGEDTDLYFLVGADTLLELPRWREPDALLRECQFLAVTRPGYDLAKILQYRHLGTGEGGGMLESVLLEEVPSLDISSSQVRQRVREWKSVKYLVPEAVEQYLHNRQLYL